MGALSYVSYLSGIGVLLQLVSDLVHSQNNLLMFVRPQSRRDELFLFYNVRYANLWQIPSKNTTQSR